MTRSLTVASLIAALLAVPIAGRAPAADTPLQLADLAWDRGDYPAALSGYLHVLDSADGDSALEPIALRTGELFQTAELTADGAVPQFAPDGRHVTYETGTGVHRITRVVPAAEPSHAIAELQGWGAAFSADGAKIAYVKVPLSPELVAAQNAFDNAGPTERTERLTTLTNLVNAASRVVLRDLANGRELELDTGTISKSALLVGAGDSVIFTGAPGGTGPAQMYLVGEKQPLTALTSDPTEKTLGVINATGTALTFTSRQPGGRGGRGGGGGGGTGRGGGQAAATFAVLSIPDGKITTITGGSPSFSADGKSLVFVARAPNETSLMIAPASDPAAASVVRKGSERLDFPAASNDGSQIAFQMMPREDWEIYTINRDGTGESRITRDIQHDIFPQFITDDRLLTVVGEGRHRRSFVSDLTSGKRTRLFHNNTVRTIAPEYLWKPSPDGTKIVIVAERDGDTVSTERGVFLVDLTRKVTRQDVRARVASNLASEQALRARGTRMFAPIADAVRNAVAETSIARLYAYQKTLFDFDSKHITRPGNKLASAYLYDTYKSFGYAPEFQWFERSNALGGQTANVVATLKGTVNPELVYVVSSHYDSVASGPGADDDSSGTAALLETARILAKRPQPATIVFASFTGEEAGLLGSREFVRRAVIDKTAIVGALNNDMVGWANDHRLDSTIRYSNSGIRDVQHAASMQFSSLITYDALYYKSTDAAAYYEAFGDIVGGIGSYPVLSSPHYHQPHDVLENMNHQLIGEVVKTTVATVMLLASSPSRLTDLKVDGFKNGIAAISWKPSPEVGVTGYIVSYGPPSKPDAMQTKTTKPAVLLTNIARGTIVAVKAVTSKGMEGWDWARVEIK
ncbi:MAG TPA: M20/M25/M40 family metallo-hydrolase [Vicinamibacterales bacterium]